MVGFMFGDVRLHGGDGLKYCFSPSVGDAIDFLRDAWDATVLRHLTLGSDSVATMLDAVSLGTVAKAAQKSVHDRATEMLVLWLQLEETSSIEVEDEGEHADELEGHQEIVDKTQLLVEAMPLLERLPSLGAKLGDFCITDAARQLCLHVKNCTSSS